MTSGDQSLADMLSEQADRALAAAAPHQALTSGGQDIGDIVARHWTLARDMGWLGMLAATDDGGMGLGAPELATLATRMGEHLFCGPFAATSVWGDALARLGARHRKFPDLAAGIASGDISLAIAGPDLAGDFVSAAPNFSFSRDSAPKLSGRRELVEHADRATHFVALDLAGLSSGETELRAALIPAGARIDLVPRQAFDMTTPVFAVDFNDVPVDPDNMLVATLDDAGLDDLLHCAHIAVAAELVGVAQACLDRAVAHACQRTQFGIAIGGFQALKHRLADGFIALSGAKLAVRDAAASRDGDAARAARYLAANAALRCAGDYIQIQGGLGFSWESEAHLYLKRARRLAASVGCSGPDLRRRIGDAFISDVLTAEGAAS